MPANTVTTMPLTDFYRRRREFEERAKERRMERMNHQDDTPHGQAVIEEMLMDTLTKLDAAIDRIATLEKILLPS